MSRHHIWFTVDFREMPTAFLTHPHTDFWWVFMKCSWLPDPTLWNFHSMFITFWSFSLFAPNDFFRIQQNSHGFPYPAPSTVYLIFKKNFAPFYQTPLKISIAFSWDPHGFPFQPPNDFCWIFTKFTVCPTTTSREFPLYFHDIILMILDSFLGSSHVFS